MHSSRPFPAKYTGTCPVCSARISPGENIIQLTHQGDRIAYHETCSGQESIIDLVAEAKERARIAKRMARKRRQQAPAAIGRGANGGKVKVLFSARKI